MVIKFKSIVTRKKHKNFSSSDPHCIGIVAGSYIHIKNILSLNRETAGSMPFMGHCLGTTISLPIEWGFLQKGGAMFMGVRRLDIEDERVVSPEEEKELASVGTMLQLKLVKGEPNDGPRHGITLWTQVWLQGENIILENVPYCLYEGEYIEGVGEVFSCLD